MWAKQVSALAGDLHIIVPDLPGHGRSNDQRWVSIADTAARVAELIALHTAGNKAHVVGLSLGGYVALQLAADFAEVLAGVTVSGVNVLPFPHPGRIRLIGKLMAPVLTWGPVLRMNARALNISDEDFDGYRAAARAMTRQAFLRVNDEVMDFRVPARAGSSACSVLAVAGEHEDDLIKRSLAEIAAGFPAGEARLVPGVGHAWNGEKPQLFSEMVRSRVIGSPLPEELVAL